MSRLPSPTAHYYFPLSSCPTGRCLSTYRCRRQQNATCLWCTWRRSDTRRSWCVLSFWLVRGHSRRTPWPSRTPRQRQVLPSASARVARLVACRRGSAALARSFIAEQLWHHFFKSGRSSFLRSNAGIYLEGKKRAESKSSCCCTGSSGPSFCVMREALR